MVSARLAHGGYTGSARSCCKRESGHSSIYMVAGSGGGLGTWRCPIVYAFSQPYGSHSMVIFFCSGLKAPSILDQGCRAEEAQNPG